MTPRSPIIVLDVADVEDLAAEARLLAEAGWSVRDGLGELPLSTHRLVCRSEVAGPEAAAEAVLAASWGAGLLLAVGLAPPQVVDHLLDDLGRLGRVRRSPTVAGQVVAPEVAQLLDLLVGGLTLKQAAEVLYLSRRTADRRLAAARRQLASSTTAETLVAWARHRGEPGAPQ